MCSFLKAERDHISDRELTGLTSLWMILIARASYAPGMIPQMLPGMLLPGLVERETCTNGTYRSHGHGCSHSCSHSGGKEWYEFFTC